VFERRVLEVFARLGPDAEIAEVESTLQPCYPLTRIVVQDDLAVRDSDPPMIYAFRDGSVVLSQVRSRD
jgi:hypothetical protein